MQQLPASITITVAVLTIFLCFITVLKFTVEDDFTRTRLMMTAFFCFIVATITISFWQYSLVTLPFTTPAWLLGALIGYLIGVRTAEHRLKAEGLRHYTEHFAHVHIKELKTLTWWSIINFYTVMSALILINLVGLSTVIFQGSQNSAIITSSVGAFLLGTIAPYLLHLWTIKIRHPNKRTTSDK